MPDTTHLAPPDPAWLRVASQITFETPYASLWEPGPRGGAWFVGATLNLSVNCLDRHLDDRGDQVALHWEGEPGDRRTLTYRELHEQVLALTRGLRTLGLGSGDRVGLHLGWLPETVVAMLACARIGAVHTVLPAPLPAEALADRLATMSLKMLFTQDGAWRHGTVLPLKSRADEALSATESVQHTVVVRRTGMDVQWYEGDRWYHDLIADTRPGGVAVDDRPVAVPSDHPICVMPQAGRRSEPVLIRHGTASVLAESIAVHRTLATSGVFWCAADITWVATQFHGIYGPLACGHTTVMYEGTLDIPSHDRAWQIVRRHEVETVLTSTSVARTIRGWARSMPEVSTLPTLRRFVTAGEPIEEEVTQWLVQAMGGGDLEIGDAWGQLELGGIVRVTGLPSSSVTEPLPDCGLDIVDESGSPTPDGEPGEVALRRAWAGQTIGVGGGAGTSALEGAWTRYPGLYATGDLAVRAPSASGERGEVTFLGRADDVVPISGQLVSLRAVCEVLDEHPYVAAADVAVRTDAALGRSLVAAVTLRPEVTPEADLDRIAVDLMDTVREMLGGLARPRGVLFVDRFGDELSRAQRARALATLSTGDRHTPTAVTWEQVLSAAGFRR